MTPGHFKLDMTHVIHSLALSQDRDSELDSLGSDSELQVETSESFAGPDSGWALSIRFHILEDWTYA